MDTHAAAAWCHARPAYTGRRYKSVSSWGILATKSCLVTTGYRVPFMPSLHVSLLGQFRVLHGEEPVSSLGGRRLQALLAYLILRPDVPQSRARLAFHFWPDGPEAQSLGNLRKVLYDLRLALPEPDRWLAADSNQVTWRGNSLYTLDVTEFQAVLAGARTPESVARGVCLYRGELLPGCWDDWLLTERERLHQDFLALLDYGIRLAEQRRDYRTATEYARIRLRHEPAHEQTYVTLMRLQAISGDRTAALQTFQLCTAALERDLGIEPSPDTRLAYERLLREASPPAVPDRVLALVGRDAEWDQVLSAWRTATTSGPHAALLRGEPGIGKTRMIEELLTWASRQGIPTLATRCYPAEGTLAYAPLVDLLQGRPLPPLDPIWLTEISRLLPAVRQDHPELPAPISRTGDAQRTHLFEALARALAGRTPLLLVVDDLQWCDPDSLQWLHFLLRRDRVAQIMLVGGLRPEGLGAGSPLAGLWPDLRRDGRLTDIAVGPLDATATARLAELATGQPLGPDRSRALFAETEGNPFFLLETLNAGNYTGDRDQRPPVAPGVRSLIQAWLRLLSPPARTVVEIGAVVGRVVEFDLLAHASRMDEMELATAMDELSEGGILRSQSPQSYHFSHDKLHEIAYDSLGVARLRLLHRRVATALLALHASTVDTVSDQIAIHLERGGRPEQAAPHYLRAARAATRIYAHDAAVQHFRAALRLLPEEERTPVLIDLGAVLDTAGRWDEAETVLLEARDLAERLDQLALAIHAEAGLGRLLRVRGRLAEALPKLQRAYNGYRGLGDQVGLSMVAGELGNAYGRFGQPSQALPYYQEQVRLARRGGSAIAISKALGELALGHRQLGEHVAAVGFALESFELAQQLGDPWALGLAYWRLGGCYHERGEPEAAIEHLHEALRLAREVGDRASELSLMCDCAGGHLASRQFTQALDYLYPALDLAIDLGALPAQGYLLNHLADAWRIQGRYEEAAQCYRRALQVGTEAGFWVVVAYALSYLGCTLALQGRPNEAEDWQVRARAMFMNLQDTMRLAACLHFHADLCLEQRRLDEARSLNEWALRCMEECGVNLMLLDNQVQTLMLRQASHEINPCQAVLELEALLDLWPEPRHQALLHYTAWSLDHSQEDHRRLAATLYQGFNERVPNAEDRERYLLLTGEHLPCPLTLPDLPAIVAEHDVDLGAVAARIDEHLATAQLVSDSKVAVTA